MGKINPEKYAENGKDLLKKYPDKNKIPLEEVKEKSLSKHTLIYDSSSETLEPIYFFILDLMNDYRFKVEKLADNFASSPGSGHFAELGQRASIMQQQGTKMLGDVNTVLRSVLNILYDLKEFRIRLSHYDDLKNPKEKEAATLALKQIWMDKVDITKGQSSIKAMALGQAGFQTLIHAFLAAKTLGDVDKLDLNPVVQRILRPRILEFNDWIEHSEGELRKRYAIEKSYLGSQVNSLKLYARWAKPYLRAAAQLEMKTEGMDKNPALVKAFNTILLELTLLGKQEIKPKEEAISGRFPRELEKIDYKREYSFISVVEFNFRGIPQRVSQQSHYAFGGRAEVHFKSYVLNSEEFEKFKEQLEISEVEDVLKLIEGSTGENIKQIQDEIDFFLKEDEPKSQSEGKSKSGDSSNPFVALVGGYESSGVKTEDKGKGKKEEKKKPEEWWPEKENYIEQKILRPFAEEQAKEKTASLFETYKKAHGMAAAGQ